MTTTDQTPTITTPPLFPESIGPHEAGEAYRRITDSELGHDDIFLYGYHAAFCDVDAGSDGQDAEEYHGQACRSVIVTSVAGRGERGERRPVYLRFAESYRHGRFSLPLSDVWDETWIELMGPGR